ncbi:MAG: Tfp pilus assembly protein PilF [Cognaticolwellia sp.]|jgi:Tfp pilus assembly protein PilF
MLLILLACSPPQEIVMGPSSLRSANGYEEELDQVDQQLLAAQERASWLDDYSADVHVAVWAQLRARLSGDYADYTLAQESIDWAFEQAPEGAGPFQSRAQLNYSLHCLDAIPADLEAAYSAILIDNNKLSSLVLTQANLDFQQGRYAQAMDGYEESLALHQSIAGFGARANARYWLGDVSGAHADMDAAEAMYHGSQQEPLAWFDLQRGLMDLERGQYDEALAHYHNADAHLGGYWLVQEHVAEIWVLQGYEVQAQDLYLDIVDRTGSPEFMDALAGLSTGAERAAWFARADSVYEQRLLDFPEASWGHALDHYLESGQADRALDLAQKNAALRGNGHATTQLAQAYLLKDAPQQAVNALQPSVDGGWTSAAAYWELHLAYQALGETAQSERNRELAVALHPEIGR